MSAASNNIYNVKKRRSAVNGAFLLSYPVTKGLRFLFDMLYKDNDLADPPLFYPDEEADS